MTAPLRFMTCRQIVMSVYESSHLCLSLTVSACTKYSTQCLDLTINADAVRLTHQSAKQPSAHCFLGVIRADKMLRYFNAPFFFFLVKMLGHVCCAHNISCTE